jgi:tRNA(adenine34) deaminase
VNFDEFCSLTYEGYLIHQQWMDRAIELAAASAGRGEVPVGAIVVDRQQNLLAEAANCKVRDSDPTAHAEIVAIRTASKALQSWRLTDCTLYVTLEPCPMCAGAIVQARLKQLVYGAEDPKTGAIQSVLNIPDSAASNHRLSVIGGIREQACRQQLRDWFARQRKK